MSDISLSLANVAQEPPLPSRGWVCSQDILKNGDKIYDYIDSLRKDKKPVLCAPMGKLTPPIPQKNKDNLLRILIENATKS